MRVNKELLRACVYGGAVGDALGVPYEMMWRDKFTCTGMVGFGTWCKPAGTYSDDTGMTLALLDSVAHKRGFDETDIRARFEMWLSGEYMADHDTFDCGNTVSLALIVGRGMDGEASNGNGSLMRVGPLAALNCNDAEVALASAVTHAHKQSTETCARFVRLVRDAHASLFDAKAQIIDLGIAGMRRDQISSGGYVMDTFTAALWCFSTTANYRDCVLKAVNLGRDTDTTACVAGCLAASAYGFDSIPSYWFDELRGKDEIERVLAGFDNW